MKCNYIFTLFSYVSGILVQVSSNRGDTAGISKWGNIVEESSLVGHSPSRVQGGMFMYTEEWNASLIFSVPQTEKK